MANETSIKSKKGAKKAAVKPGAAKPALLAGGNPRIAKADDDAAVQAYIAAMPGWKSDVGRHIDALIVRIIPGVHKAVKWNSPLYGVEGYGWFLGIHCFAMWHVATGANVWNLRSLLGVLRTRKGLRPRPAASRTTPSETSGRRIFYNASGAPNLTA